MRTIRIDCGGIRDADDLWERYLRAAEPRGADLFGRNLDAFWDALHGGPGWPGGDVALEFTGSAALRGVRSRSGTISYLDALQAMASEGAPIRLIFR